MSTGVNARCRYCEYCVMQHCEHGSSRYVGMKVEPDKSCKHFIPKRIYRGLPPRRKKVDK